jgi:hypothetical protein
LGCTFGWVAFPGEYIAFARGYKLMHEAGLPSQAKWHNDVPFKNKTLMDDGVLIEPEIGIRPGLSALWMTRAMTVFFGPIVSNLEKLEFRPKQTLWGSQYDTDCMAISYPEAKH